LLRFSVIDNGIGIAPQDLKRLFQPFVQVDSKLNRQFDGTGLGLALVQKLTDLHGGSVEVESTVGTGSCFTINLPWDQERQPPSKPIEPDSGASPKESAEQPKCGVVLLAEDNVLNSLTTAEYLENHGFRVVKAHDGLEAIERAELNDPDIILMDIQMPVMDGMEAIRRLRANPRFDRTPILALTALAMPGDRERSLEAGAHEYLSKPVNLRTLMKTILELTGQH
jgi:CheY-like chemotaxis protein